ncbi:MAG: MFS transporter [Spirochaetaceae bacterium]|nr:MAG: MFS transporter [Spirochaetaceae bacterium]
MKKLHLPFHGPGTTARFSLLLAMFWSSVVSIEVFLVPFLIRSGLSPTQAGYVMSAIFLVSIVSQPLWGLLCDRSGRHRAIVAGCLTAGGIVVLVIPVVAASFLAVVGLGMLYSATANSMPGIMDSWIMRERSLHGKVNYGVARAMGSLGYALTSVVMGRIYDRVGLGLNFPVYAIFVLSAVFVALTVRTSGRTVDSNSGHADATPRTAFPKHDAPAPLDERGGGAELIPAVHDTGVATLARAVLANREYLWFLVATTGVIIALRATMTFLPLLIYSVGGTNAHVGLANSVSAGSEIPFMIAAAFLVKRFRPRTVLLASMFVFVIRVGLLAFVGSPVQLVLVQLLHGPSFGVFLPSAIYFIDRIAPVQFKTAFQTLAPAVFFGIGSVVGSSIGGAMVDQIGLLSLYRTAPALILVSAMLFGLTVVAPHRRPGATGSPGKPV